MSDARILVVDDDPAFRSTYEVLLGDEGYAVETASNRKEALAKIEDDRWDVVLLDQKLDGPGGPDGGIELSGEIRLRAPSAKVIIVTGYADAASIRRAFDAGVFDYVEKTEVLQTLLLARLRHALDIARARRMASLASSAIERQIQANWNAAKTEADPNRKGALLEDVLADLLRTIPGFEQVDLRRKNDIEELDILVRNASTDAFWSKESQYILVECKNWSKPVGVDEATRFAGKLEKRHGRCTLGFFVAMNGVTAPFREELRLLSKSSFLVVPLVQADIDALVAAIGQRSERLKQMHDRAMV